MPADLNDLAEGRIDRLRRPPRAPERLVEPEGSTHVVPGVRNSEARAVYDRRVARLRASAEAGDDAALEVGFYEVQLLALWRARNVTDFDAFAEHVVGLDVERARALAAGGAAKARAAGGGAKTASSRREATDADASDDEAADDEATDDDSPAPDASDAAADGGEVGGAVTVSPSAVLEVSALPRELVALWIRTEAALMQIVPNAAARIVYVNGRPDLEIRVSAVAVPSTVEALKQLGPALTGLAKLTAAVVPERPRR